MNSERLFVQLRKQASVRVAALLTCGLLSPVVEAGALVFQTDFGLKDGAVASMKAVAYSVDPELPMFDITNEIPAYNIWEAALRLDQSANYWPPGTVFVSVVDPGVGSERRSVVLKTRSGHYFVSPDNGSLTFVAESLGVEQVREIDEASISIYKGEELVVKLNLTYVNTFAGVGPGQPLLYMNDLGKVALALNMESFSERFGIASGSEWKVRINKVKGAPADT